MGPEYNYSKQEIEKKQAVIYNKKMIILAIETSCDDTCVALVKVRGRKNPSFKILSNTVSSQVKIHQKWGGVYPTLAKREHQKNLPIVFKKAVKEAQNPKIDLIAVTIGPGLEPCLWVGINFTREIAKKLHLSVLPINHIEAHIVANWLPPIHKMANSRFLISKQIKFPAICLVVSGGHTQLILMKNIGKYKILGETRDDAAGECFDKVARILGLGYPGGPAIAAMAAKVLRTKNEETKRKKSSELQTSDFRLHLPRPMIYQKNYDFSFSGLKTAVLYDYRNRTHKIRKSKKYIQEMANEVQQAVIDVLIYKTLKAARACKAKAIILSGGVAANNELRRQFENNCQKENLKFLVPAKNLCTDNAAMVAATAYYHWLKKKAKGWRNIGAEANLHI